MSLDRVDPEAERLVRRQRVGAPRQRCDLGMHAQQLVSEPRFADPRLAVDEHDAEMTSSGLGQLLLEDAQHSGATDKRNAPNPGHDRTATTGASRPCGGVASTICS